MDVLALVPDKGGPKLQASKEGSVSSLATGERGQMIFTRTSVVTLVNTLANFTTMLSARALPTLDGV
jgi:hypothetical protein